jgi:hypothetical protein
MPYTTGFGQTPPEPEPRPGASDHIVIAIATCVRNHEVAVKRVLWIVLGVFAGIGAGTLFRSIF